jgi:hypothetical protein
MTLADGVVNTNSGLCKKNGLAHASPKVSRDFGSTRSPKCTTSNSIIADNCYFVKHAGSLGFLLQKNSIFISMFATPQYAQKILDNLFKNGS